MKKYKIIVLSSLLVLVSLALLSYVSFDEKDNFSERVKIALRDSGNKLLIQNKDSISLILPILEIERNIFELSFQSKFSVAPDTLVSIIERSLRSSNLPNTYIVEVINSISGEVSYSYEIKQDIEKNIIPCIGRNLPYDRYKIKILFTNQQSVLILDKNYSLLSLVVIGFLGFGLVYWKMEKSSTSQVNISKIGSYEFYKDQNKLVRGNITIELTSKECELIAMFAEKPNQIIKRDLIIKEIWEDNGVFVGRSLDNFISKIRKKIQDDNSVNIITVHGVGYRLEIS